MIFQNTSERHLEGVSAWAAQSTKNLPPDKILDLFDRAFATIWKKSGLGNITLSAIAERALIVISEKYPVLNSVKIANDKNFLFDDLRKQNLRDQNLNIALQILLAEFISIIGSLTGEVLAPLLHDELKKVTLKNLTVLRSHGDSS